MKKIVTAIWFCMLCLQQVQVMADEQLSVAVYVHPDKLEHPVRIGLLPYYTHWVLVGDVAVKAAIKAFGAHYQQVGMCEDGEISDLLVTVNPKIKHNPGIEKIFAEVQVNIYRADGSLLGEYRGQGDHDAQMRSVFMDDAIHSAFDAATQDAVSTFLADGEKQKIIAAGLPKGSTPMPCSLVSALGHARSSK